jgi:hypothetical protein
MTGKRPTLRDCIRALRGALHLGKRRYEQALADFDRFIELGVTDTWAIDGRRETYRKMRRYDQALADHDRARTRRY